MASNNSNAANIQNTLLAIRSTPSMESLTSVPSEDPPPYSAQDPNATATHLHASHDPRASSTQSLVASDLSPAGLPSHRRTLLLVFIHGFMGDETSFQSFPAHVHNLISVLVSETHTVHTKIYPRYRSRRPIQVASADFSAWLQPHESPDTDVVLIGHSMGGLLAAEVALLPSLSPTDPTPLRHRLLGTISFDTPFLGMHPGVIRSGITSLFRFDPSPPNSPRNGPASPYANPSAEASPFSSTGGLPPSGPNDPNYNPAFPNDVRLPVRSGWKNAQHFVRKHAKHLRTATQQLVTSHLEFGSCLADLEGLKLRYCKIRMLEDNDPERRGTAIQENRLPSRVRFVNYYTASTGRPKHPTALAPTPSDPSVVTPSPPYPDEKRPINTERIISEDATGPPQTTGSELEHENVPGSDDESLLSELSDLDTFDDTSSEFSMGTSVVSPSEISVPKAIPEDGWDESSSAAQVSLQSNIEPKRHLPLSPFPPTGPPLPSHFQTKTAFAAAMKQHHNMIKNNIHTFKEQQKAELVRLKNQAKQAPKAHKEELKSFLESQKVERKRFQEATKAEWKSIHEMVKNEMEARRKDVAMAKTDGKKIVERQLKNRRRLDHKMERLDRKCERNQAKMERKANKIKPGPEDDASTQGYDVSTAPITESINTLELSDMESSSKSLPGPRRSSTMDSTSSNATSHQSAPWSNPPTDSGQYTAPPPWAPHSSSNPSIGPKAKDKKFCVLPPKDASGARDPTWVRVFMKDVDEVGAHCGLFFPVGPGEEIKAGAQWGERYSWLVQDTAGRVEDWISNAVNERASDPVASAE